MTFYELWPQIKEGSVAKRTLAETGSSETPNLVYIRFNGDKIEKKFEIGSSVEDWHVKNLDNFDTSATNWVLV